MGKYRLSRNVLFVKGKKKGIIYNFNNRSLYRVNNSWDEECDLAVAENNKTAIDYLIAEGILVSESFDEQELIPIYENKISHAWVEITEKCNLNCVHCYEDKNNKSMSVSFFCEVIDKIAEYGINSVQITGGEPTLHHDLTEMLKYARNNVSQVELYTNGVLLSNEIIEFCLKNNIKLAVTEIGNKEEDYNRITRTQGYYYKYRENLSRLKRSGAEYRIGDINVDGIFDGIELPRLVGNATIDLYTKEMLGRKIITKEQFEGHFIPEIVSCNLNYNKCFSANIYIDVVGDIYPCPMEKRVKHGNIGSGSLPDILKEEIFRLNKDYVNECNNCEYRYVCTDCRPDSLNGNIKEKPWFCSYSPELGMWENPDTFVNKLLQKKRKGASCIIQNVREFKESR